MRSRSSLLILRTRFESASSMLRPRLTSRTTRPISGPIGFGDSRDTSSIDWRKLELALHFRAEALVLDVAGEGRERIDLAPPLLALLLRLRSRRLGATGIALHARAERLGRRPAEHRRDPPEEEQHADEGGRRDDVLETDQRSPADMSPKTFCGSLMPAASNFSENFGRMPVGRRRPWTLPST